MDCEQPCFGINCDNWVLGCTDPNASNYSADATLDDGTCTFNEAFCEQAQNQGHELCSGCDSAEQQVTGFRSGAKGRTEEEICDPFTGATGECTDPLACNYNPDAAAAPKQ